MKKAACKPTKHPCKICFQTVNKKNGVQCQGVCRKWVHFECLNYTPGKIKDIKAGHIKIMCPCPDCNTEPKEIRLNPPFTCMNEKCPANNKPKCDSENCPLNEGMVCGKDQCSKNIANVDPYQCAPQQCGSPQQCPPQSCNSQYGPPQHCPPQHCPPQPCPSQYGPSKHGNPQHCPPQHCPPQHCPPLQCLPKPCPSEYCPPQPCPTEYCPPQPCPTEYCSPQPCPTEYCSPQPCPTEYCIPQPCPTEYCIPQPCPSEYCPPQPCPSEYCPTDYCPPPHCPPKPCSTKPCPPPRCPPKPCPPPRCPPKPCPPPHCPRPPQCPPQYCIPPPHCPPQYCPQYGPPSPCGSFHNLKGREECPGRCPSGFPVRTDSYPMLIETTASNFSFSTRPCNLKSKSCLCISKCVGPGSNHYSQPSQPKLSLSDSHISINFGDHNNVENSNRNNRSMECALEQMCNTVGLLSHQIRDLMCKMME